MSKGPVAVRQGGGAVPGGGRTRDDGGGSLRRNAADAAAAQFVECRYCGRKFGPDVIERHQQICTKATLPKRPTFNSYSHRVAGNLSLIYRSKMQGSSCRIFGLGWGLISAEV